MRVIGAMILGISLLLTIALYVMSGGWNLKDFDMFKTKEEERADYREELNDKLQTFISGAEEFANAVKMTKMEFDQETYTEEEVKEDFKETSNLVTIKDRIGEIQKYLEKMDVPKEYKEIHDEYTYAVSSFHGFALYTTLYRSTQNPEYITKASESFEEFKNDFFHANYLYDDMEGELPWGGFSNRD